MCGNHRRRAPGPCSARMRWSSGSCDGVREAGSGQQSSQETIENVWQTPDSPMGKMASFSPLTATSWVASWSRMPVEGQGSGKRTAVISLQTSTVGVTLRLRTLMEKREFLYVLLEALRVGIAKGSSQCSLEAEWVSEVLCCLEPAASRSARDRKARRWLVGEFSRATSSCIA